MNEEPIDTLNVIPFVDIMLVLLTIVLTTTSFIATGRIPVALPQATHSQVEKQQDKTIELAVGGGIYFESEPVSKEQLADRVKALPRETPFLIRADRAIAFQQFIDVADLLKQFQFNKVAVQTQITSR